MTYFKKSRGYLYIVFHAFFFGIYPFLAAWEFNYFEVYPSNFLSILPWLLISILASLFILKKLLGSLNAAAIFFTLLALLTISYGSLVKFIQGGSGQDSSGLVDLQFQTKELLILLPVLLLLLLLARVLKRKNTWLKDATICLNLFALLLLSFSGLGLLVSTVEEQRTRIGPDPLATVSWQSSSTSPDVYYIILDGFGGSEMLNKKYAFNNEQFISTLKKHQFYIADKSFSNYPRTNYSLASSLSSAYLEEPLFFRQKRVSAKRIAEALIRNSAVLNAFSRANYKIIATETGYKTTELQQADRYVPVVSQNYLLSTALGYVQFPLIRLSISNYLHEQRRERILKEYEIARQLETEAQPKFVFLHIVAPHPPFVFNADGSKHLSDIAFILGDGHGFEGAPNYRERYVEQAKYIERLTSELVEHLMSMSKKPIIIIQGDHGPGSDYNLESAEQTDLWERFSILNAYYFPDQDYGALYPSISPVNSFRVVLNKLSGKSIDLLPDKSYFSAISKPYDFVRVVPKEISDEH